jgi:hypothetical protein
MSLPDTGAANRANLHAMWWGYSLEAWGRIGVALMFFGAGLGVLALLASLASAYVLKEVADTAQKQLVQQAQSSSERIAALTAQSDQLRKDTVEANRKAEAERLERLRLEASVAPRTLTVSEQTRLGHLLAPLSGKRISVISYVVDGEGARLASQIIAALKSAGVSVDAKVGTLIPNGGILFGVNIWGSNSETAALLRSAMTSAGVLVSTPDFEKRTDLLPPSESNLAAVIFVGVKPIFYSRNC